MIPSNYIKKNKDYFDELDLKYPNRRKEIHKVCCQKCPSEHNRINNIEDPESKSFKDNMTKNQIAKEVLFVCAWRNSKLCKGLCDYFEIDQEYLNNQK